MQVNMTQESKSDSLTAHIVLGGLVNALKDVGAFEKFLEGKLVDNDYFLDVKVTVEGQEIDLESFIKQWQSKVDTLVEAKAKDMVITRMGSINTMLDEVQQRIENS